MNKGDLWKIVIIGWWAGQALISPAEIFSQFTADLI
jgi:hypothetical protein